MSTENIDEIELKKFKQMASQWWDEQGPVRTLHAINPLRLQFVRERCSLEQQQLLDVGCGGGIFCEALAQAGAKVTGIDMAEPLITVAKMHQHDSAVNIDYQLTTAEDFAPEHKQQFDVITCMELLEHVPDPQSLLQSLTLMLKPGGDLFVSTIARNAKAYLHAIIGAEYVLNMLPKGTHDYAKFIKPSELSRTARQLGLSLQSLAGLNYNPITQIYSLNEDVSVNYLAHFKRETA